MKKILMSMALVASAYSAPAVLTSSSAHASECGEVSIALWDWASGELMANLDAFILEHGYGCKVELAPGGTTTIFAAMDSKGKPNVASELWINAVRDPLNKAFDAGTMHSVNSEPITELGEGWWITPKFAEEHPDLDTVVKILEHPELFPDSEDSSKGAFIGCPAGWGCQLSNANLYRAFKMEEKGWKLIDPGSSAGLDGSMTKAVERGQPWFGYYWSPTAMIGKHSMKLVPFGVDYAGDENWNGCIALPEQECDDPKPSAWTQSEVHTVITDDFKKTGSPAIGFLEKRIFPGAIMNEMLVFMGEEQASGEDATVEFLKKHEDLWTTWVNEEAAEKIKTALKSS